MRHCSRRLLKLELVLLVLVLSVTVVLFLSTTSRRMDCSPRREHGISAQPSRTSARGDNEQTAATELLLRPLSAQYNGTPISRLYRPGFAVDSAACGEDGSGLQLVVVVHSAHKNHDLRAAVRHTWGSLGLRSDTAVVFLLGESPDQALTSELRQESLTHGDVVVSNNLDTYDNLTLKTVAMSEWVSLRCPRARFFLKTDDDVFINVPRLLEFLRRPEVSTANRTVFGGMTRGTHPIRDRSHRHYISEEEYPGDVFVDYMQGACYLVTGDLSRDLYRVSLQERFFRMEDIFFTGLMAERVGANKVGPKNFYTIKHLLKKSKGGADSFDPCNLRSKLAVHYVIYDDMFYMWRSVHIRKLKC